MKLAAIKPGKQYPCTVNIHFYHNHKVLGMAAGSAPAAPNPISTAAGTPLNGLDVQGGGAVSAVMTVPTTAVTTRDSNGQVYQIQVMPVLSL